MEFESVDTEEQMELLAKMANTIWHEYWPERIGAVQTDYMIDKFQSLDALRRDITEQGYDYWFIKDGATVVGYTGTHVEADKSRLFISKIYLLENARGKGYARKTVEFLERVCHERSLSSMYLTVNKGNDIAIRAYVGLGFETIDAVVSDIGGGFVMDDYIMEKAL